MTDTQRSKQRRQRRLFAAIAGWVLLGAASTGIVACSNANAAEGSAAAQTTTAGAAAGGSGTAAPNTAPTESTKSAASATAEPSAAAPSVAAQTTAAPTTATPTAETAAAQASTYADGTYTATGSYSSPGGTESVSITLTLTADTVTDASAVGEAAGGPSEQYQSAFVSNFAALVVGKDIASVSLDKVAGSSLTSNGFNAAVETIKSDALA